MMNFLSSLSGMGRQSGSTSRLKATWTVTIICVVALALRVPLLSGSLWLDEAAQALESVRPLNQQLDIIPDFQPPLLHLLLHFAQYLGSSEAWLRTVGALIPGLIMIVATFFIGEKVAGRRGAMVASLLLATSSFHIFYSQELRPYALPAAIGLVSWWLLLTLTDSPDKRRSPRWWFGYAALTTLGLYSSYLYPFLVFGQVGYWFLQQRRHLIPLTLSLLMGGICFLPWLPTFQLQLAAGGLLRTSLPGWTEVVSTPQALVWPMIGVKFVFGVLDVEPTPGFLLGSGAVVISLVLFSVAVFNARRRFSASDRRRFIDHVLFLGCWIVIPLVSAWLVSFWVPVIQPKRVLFVLPACYLVVGYGLSLISKTRSRFITASAMALPVVLLIINVIGTSTYYLNPRLQRENWKALHQTVTQRYPADKSLALFAFSAPFSPWEWYDDGSYPTLSLEPLKSPNDSVLAERMKGITEYQYVILFDYLTDLTDPDRRLESQLQAFGYQVVEIIDQPNIGFVRVYGHPNARLSDSGLSSQQR